MSKYSISGNRLVVDHGTHRAVVFRDISTSATEAVWYLVEKLNTLEKELEKLRESEAKSATWESLGAGFTEVEPNYEPK